MSQEITVTDKLAELLVQATSEKSHYYVASVCREAIDEILRLKRLVAKLEREVAGRGGRSYLIQDIKTKA